MKFGGELVEFGRFENIHKPFIYEISKLGLRFILILSIVFIS